mmetsp:Transcript_21439/g.55991  ORF Transcript_21439/g.55991 Transcript_21439/m.55991 type:complete len:228 (+) Transcript_21439:1125-1808(+)
METPTASKTLLASRPSETLSKTSSTLSKPRTLSSIDEPWACWAPSRVKRVEPPVASSMTALIAQRASASRRCDRAAAPNASNNDADRPCGPLTLVSPFSVVADLARVSTSNSKCRESCRRTTSVSAPIARLSPPKSDWYLDSCAVVARGAVASDSLAVAASFKSNWSSVLGTKSEVCKERALSSLFVSSAESSSDSSPALKSPSPSPSCEPALRSDPESSVSLNHFW